MRCACDAHRRSKNRKGENEKGNVIEVTLSVIVLAGVGRDMYEGPLKNSDTRDAAFFRLGFTPSPSSRSLCLDFQRVTLFFTAVRLFSVYFGLASRPIFAVRDCVTLERFLRFTPSYSRVTQFMNGLCSKLYLPPRASRGIGVPLVARSIAGDNI